MKSNLIERKGVSSFLLLFLLSVLLVVGLGFLALWLRPDAARDAGLDATVRIYCASGIAKPVQKVIDAYNQEFDAKVEIVRTGGSGELAGQIKTEYETGLVGGADLYVTADANLLEKARDEGIVAERFDLAEQRPVIAVPIDSSWEIKGLKGLVDVPLDGKAIRYGVASSRAAVGKLARKIAQREGLLEALESNKATDSENVMTLAQALVAGSLDAAIIWDTTVAQLNQAATEGPVLKVAALADQLDQWDSEIAVGVVATSESPTAALKFARYLTSPEKGKDSFESFGFQFVEGDHWEEVPEIHLYSGSMFTPVLEEEIRRFASREGINIYPRWEGCGKLVASMKSLQRAQDFPDAYLACDVLFLDEVREFFESVQTVSQNQIVIAVRKGVSIEIQGPADLLNEDLRIGICDPELSALGRLTKLTLSEPPYEGIYDRLNETAAVSVDVGPTLLSQLMAEGLDAALVYRSNVMAHENARKQLKLVELNQKATSAVATQPWAVSRTTSNPALMGRLFEAISREEIRRRFENYGFNLKDLE